MVLFHIPITGEFVGAVLGVGICICIFWFCHWIIPAVKSTTSVTELEKELERRVTELEKELERRVTELEKAVGHMQSAQFE